MIHLFLWWKCNNQASEVGRKKESMRKKVDEMEEEVKHLKEELKEKRKLFDGHDIHFVSTM